MIQKIGKNIAIFLGFQLVILGILYLYFPSIVLHPNSIVTATTEDGLKNYYTFVYHVVHGSGIRFEGMFYPFGEHSTFTDNQPGLSVPLAWFNQHISDISNNIFFIFHYLLLFGFTCCSFFTFKILRHYKISFLMSVFAAIVITLMSPQFFRAFGHFALSYGVMPVAIYFLIRIEVKKVSWLGLAVLILFSAWTALLHPYLLLVTTVFLFTYVAFQLVVKRKIDWQLLAYAILPIVLFKAFMLLTDKSPFRPDNPYGLIAYRAKFEDVFFPFYDPMGGWFRPTFKQISLYYSESYAFVGIAGQLVVIFLLVYLIHYLIRRRLLVEINSQLATITFVSFITLIVARYLPTWNFVFDLLPSLKQFRSLGRLSWIFYYCFTVFSFYLLYQIFLQIKTKVKWASYLLLLLVLTLVVWDLHTFLTVNKTSFDLYSGKNKLSTNFEIRDQLAKYGKTANDFEAILTLPMSTLGNERIGIPMPWHSSQLGLPYSFQTGLPNTAVHLSRSSIPRTLELLQLQSSKYIEKEIIPKFKRGKPLLLIIENRDTTFFRSQIQVSQSLGSLKDLSLYELELVALPNGAKLMDEEKSLAHKIQKHEFFYNDSSNFCIYKDFCEGFDGLKSGFVQPDTSTIIEKTFSRRLLGEIEISLWYKVDFHKGGPVRFKFEAYDGEDLIFDQDFGDMEVNDFEVFSQWVRMKKSYDLADLTASKIRLSYIRIGRLELGTVMIKDPDFNVFVGISDTSGIYNNYLVNVE